MTPDAVGPASRPAPVVVITDEVGRMATTCAIAQAAGRLVINGWQLPANPWDVAPHSVVVSGYLAGGSTETELVDAVVRGAGAIIGVPPDVEPPARLVDALQRVTSVVEASECPTLMLDAAQVHLLVEIARGKNAAEAARSAHLSVRTAHRRIAEAREILGAGSTNAAAAVVADALRFWAP
jgi:hypothetical protein